ncbi:hypothetical protein KJ975_01330, partial [Myxococcota bacterium]|nr:hypothetical protein [Myxococcota bacterium]
GTIALIDPATGVVQKRLRRSEQGIYTVRWSPDGRHLAATGDDSAVTVWDTLSGRPRMVFLLGQSVMAADFSPSGRALVFADSAIALTIPMAPGGTAEDPQAMLQQAQQDAGMVLRGFNLVQEP